MVYASAMGTFTMGIISIGNKGGRAHEGLMVHIAAVDTRVKSFEGTPEAWSRYRHSPTLRSGSGDRN